MVGIRRPKRSFGIRNPHGKLQSLRVRAALYFSQKNRDERLIGDGSLFLLTDGVSDFLLVDGLSRFLITGKP